MTEQKQEKKKSHSTLVSKSLGSEDTREDRG